MTLGFESAYLCFGMNMLDNVMRCMLVLHDGLYKVSKVSIGDIWH